MDLRRGAAAWILAAILSPWTAGAWAQDVILETKTFLSRDKARAGETFKAALRLGVGPAWHINANPVNDDFLIPTTVDIGENPDFQALKIVYPSPLTARFEFSEAEALVYSGTTTFGMLVKAREGLAPGTYRLKGSVTYQACNAKSCLAPETLAFEMEVMVASPGEETAEINPDVFAGIDFAK